MSERNEHRNLEFILFRTFLQENEIKILSLCSVKDLSNYSVYKVFVLNCSKDLYL